MRRVIYPKVGGPDSIEVIEVEDLVAGPGEVRVRVHRAGINFADLMMRQGLYGSAPDFPFTPGYETAGEVMDVGSGVEGVSSGDRVIAMTGFGGYAEQAVVTADRIVKLPDSISFDKGAAIPVAYGTAYHMLVHLGGLHPGDTVLVHHAAGGVGTAAAQICTAYEASLVIGTASGPKREFVEAMGMRFVDRESEDFVEVCKRMTDGEGVHQAIDPVGGKHLMRSYRALRNGGKLHVFGASSAVSGERRSWFAAMRMWWGTPRFDPLKMMNSNKAVFGVHMGRLKDDQVFRGHLESLSGMMLKGQIDPVIDSVWRFEQVADAQRHMHDRKNRGKVLLDFS